MPLFGSDWNEGMDAYQLSAMRRAAARHAKARAKAEQALAAILGIVGGEAGEDYMGIVSAVAKLADERDALKMRLEQCCGGCKR